MENQPVKIYDDLGVLIPEVYLPKAGVDPKKWAVIACDQFTSERGALAEEG